MIGGFFANNITAQRRQVEVASSLRRAGRQLSSAEGERGEESKPTKVYDHETGQYHFVGGGDSAQLCGTGLDIGGTTAAQQQVVAKETFYHGERPSDLRTVEREEFYEKEAMRDMQHRRELFQQQRAQQQAQHDHSSSLRQHIDDVKRSLRGGQGPVVVPPAPPKPWEQGQLAPVVRRPARRQVESFSANASQLDLKVGDSMAAAQATAAAPGAQARAAAAREASGALRMEAAMKIGLAHGGSDQPNAAQGMASQGEQMASARAQRSRLFGAGPSEEQPAPYSSGRARGGFAPRSSALRSVIPDHGDSGIRMNVVGASYDPCAIDNQMGSMASHTHVARRNGNRVSAPPGGQAQMDAFIEQSRSQAHEQYVPARKQIEEHPNTSVQCNNIGGYGAPQDDPLDADIGRSCTTQARTARRTARVTGDGTGKLGAGFVGGDLWHSGTDQAAGEVCTDNPRARPAGRFEGGFHRKVLPAGASALAVENKNLAGEGEGHAIGSDLRGNVRVVGPRAESLSQARAAATGTRAAADFQDAPAAGVAAAATASSFDAAVEAEARRRMLSAHGSGFDSAASGGASGYVRAVGSCAATDRRQNALADVSNAVGSAPAAAAAAVEVPTSSRRSRGVTAGSFNLSDYGGV